MREMPMSKVAEAVGETDTRLWRMLFATEGKDKETWLKFVAALEAHNGHRHAITQASMDMSGAYQSGVAENCRHAQVVFDKFHVIKNANEAVDKVRVWVAKESGKRSTKASGSGAKIQRI